MTITLSPEQEAQVRRAVESGEYETAEEYVSEAIKSLHENRQWLDEQREKIEQGWQEAERGDLISAEELLENMKAWKAEWLGLEKTA